MNRRTLLGTFGFSMLAARRAVGAQQAGKVYRISYLTVPSRDSAGGVANTFQLALHDLGWVAGQNVVIDYRFADSNMDRLPDLAADLVRLKPDVIVAGANAAVMAAKNATSKTPIVMFLTIEPVGAGFVKSLAQPSGNVTGLTMSAGREIFGKQLQILKDAFPRISRVTVFVNQAAPTYAQALHDISTATRALGLQQRAAEVRDHAGLERAFAEVTTANTDAIFLPSDSMFYQHRVWLAQLAAKTRLPAMWGLREHAEAGGLMAYSTDLNDLARRAAAYVDRILKGAKPGDLPVEQPTKFELVINLKTAKALGLAVPQSVLLRADQVIE